MFKSKNTFNSEYKILPINNQHALCSSTSDLGEGHLKCLAYNLLNLAAQAPHTSIYIISALYNYQKYILLYAYMHQYFISSMCLSTVSPPLYS